MLWREKTRNSKKLKIKFQQRRFNLTYSIDKKNYTSPILLPFSNKISLLKLIFSYLQQLLRTKLLFYTFFNYISRLNHNPVKNKIKHFPKLYALGQQIGLKARSLVVSDLYSDLRFPVRVRLLAMCGGELSAVIAQIIPKCLRSGLRW